MSSSKTPADMKKSIDQHSFNSKNEEEGLELGMMKKYTMKSSTVHSTFACPHPQDPSPHPNLLVQEDDRNYFWTQTIKVKTYWPVVFWLVMSTLSIAGTCVSDFIDRTLEWGYPTGMGVFLGILLFIMGCWKLSAERGAHECCR
ncbi:hypothetical protein ACHAWU_007082 [Discostella pseudostelligera]|uniref:Uncharacterized protein n=1 Tax=Discostella pseudostelligera TaxID=259834 RepID=A0ABD3N194_9STRA